MKEKILLDVRTPEECKAQRIKNSVEMPLSTLKWKEELIAKLLKGKKVSIICRNGKRSEIAKSMLEKHIDRKNLEIYKWWVTSFQKEHPDKVIMWGVGCNIAIVHQVQIIVWILILMFCLLGCFLSPYFYIGAVLAGIWTIYTWVTWVCYTARWLSKLKFNRNNTYN